MTVSQHALTSVGGPADRAYAHVRELVFSGKLPPGTRLVTRTLAAETGTSLNPVREALGRLASEGIVDHVPGAGSFVRRLGRREVEEIYEMREALESHAAESAARLITEAELEELAAVCESWHGLVRRLRNGPNEDEVEDFVRAWVDQNQRFHALLVEAARNSLLTRTVKTFRLQEAVFVHQRRHGPLPLGEAARTWASHTRLLRALRRRDGIAASMIVREQMKTGRRYMLARLREEGESRA